MKQIRRCVFETNSSSTHSLSIVSKEVYEKFKNGEGYIDEDDNLITREDVLKELKSRYKVEIPEDEDELEELIRDYGYYDYYNYGDGYEDFEYNYKTPNGDEIVIFGYHGWS